jgi:hypothetical protein
MFLSVTYRPHHYSRAGTDDGVRNRGRRRFHLGSATVSA